MTSRTVCWYTNKEVIVVRGTDVFADWLRGINGFELSASQAIATPGCFLVDSRKSKPFSLDKPFSSSEVRKELMRGWFTRVFESELSDLGLRPEAWPNTSCIETFQAFFSVEYQPLIADFGAQALQTSLVPQ